jgi:hypothetical protein
MRSRRSWSPIVALAFVSFFVSATVTAGQTTGIFGVVAVDVKDPQHRPVPHARRGWGRVPA